MTYTSESASRFSNPYLAAASPTEAVPRVTTQIRRLSVNDQLALLWYAYTEMGDAITPAAPGAARLQLAEGLLNQIRQASYAQQLQIMQDLVNQTSTPASRAYGVLSVNTKLAFWYVLAQWMTEGIVVPMPADYQISTSANIALQALKQLDMGQQITVLRNVVAAMGVDPLA